MKNKTFRYISLIVTVALLISFFPVEQILDAQGYDYFATENTKYFEKINSALEVADKKQSEDSKFSAKTIKINPLDESEILNALKTNDKYIPADKFKTLDELEISNSSQTTEKAELTISAEPENNTNYSYIVTFKKSAGNRQIYLALKDHEFKMLGSSAAKSFLLEGIDSEEFYEQNQNIIQSLEPDMKVKSIFGFEVVNDTLVGLQWAVEDFNLKEAWAFEQNENSVKIAIIDTGIYADHDDFENTTILDGWDFVRNRVVRSDYIGHGTAVSGLIAASSGNFKGITGIAPNSTILPLQAFSDGGNAYESDIIEALYFAADSGSQIINMSYGGDKFSVAENTAIQYALSKNCILVAAAGNTGDSTLMYPASYDGVISVAAHDSYQDWAYFSTYNSKVDFSAPGVDVLSLKTGNTFDYVDGTSFAAPYISGVAALALLIDPNLTNVAFYNELKNASIDLGPAGYDNYHGFGKIDTVKLLENLGGTLPVKSTSTWIDTGNYDISWYDSLKTSFEIFTPEQLAGLAKLVNQGNSFQGKTINQTEDIDLYGYNWIPIGYNSEPTHTYNTFQGTYNGNLYEIKNMTIDIQLGTTVNASVGFFGRVVGGKIKNIIIGDGSSISFSQSDVENTSLIGGIAGFTESNFPMENCHNSANIYVSSKAGYVGGIAGSSTTAIKNSTNSGNIISHITTGNTGGVTGLNRGGIYSSYNKGNIMGYGLDQAIVGGIAGSNTGIISETYNSGNVSGTSGYDITIGGLAGSNYGAIYKSYNMAYIMGGGLFNIIGGISGNTAAGSKVEASINYGSAYSIMNIAYVGGIAGENGGEILNCQNAGGSHAGNGFLLFSGGIAGNNAGGKIDNSIHHMWGSTGAGGGFLTFSAGIAAENTGEIINCSTHGFVVGNYSEIIYVGGITAINSFDPEIQSGKSGIIKNSFNKGYFWINQAVSGNGRKIVGGIAAYNDSLVENCYNGMSIYDTSNSGEIMYQDGGDIVAHNMYLEDESGKRISTGTILHSYYHKTLFSYHIGTDEGIVKDSGYFDIHQKLTPIEKNQIIGGKTDLLDALNAGLTLGMKHWVSFPEINEGLPVNFISVTDVNIIGSSNISAGFYSKMEAEINPNNATNKDIIWSIENLTGMASVDQTGIVTAIKPGTVIVRVACAGPVYAFKEKELTIVNLPAIVFETGGGTKIPDIIQEPGSPVTIPANPQKTGYTFIGWDRPIPEIMPPESTIITAIWKSNIYTVTFVNWNGDILKSMEVEYESSAIAPSNPTRTGYTFTGWDKSFHNIISDLTITALYKQNISGTVSITGTAKFGGIITADRSGITPSISGLTYQWRRNGSSINGAVNPSYTILQADIGQQITVKVSGAADYTGSITSPAVIPAKADRTNSPATPVLLSKTTDKIVVNTVSGHEYRLNSGSWQTSGTFSGLTQDTSYKIYSRLAETATHLSSGISAALDVRTDLAKIATNKYYISDAKDFISKIAFNEIIKNFLVGILNNNTAKVYKGSLEMKDSETVATGMKLRQYSGSTIVDELTIVVTGDITGNGKIGLSDFVQMKSHLLGKTTLAGEYAAAADISGDGKISLSDYIKLKAHLLGKEVITAKEHD